MENKAVFYVGYSTFTDVGNGMLKEEVKALDFVKDFLIQNGWNTDFILGSNNFRSLYEVIGEDRINKMKALLLNNIEKLLSVEYIPKWILVENSEIDKLLSKEQIENFGYNSIYVDQYNRRWYNYLSTPKLLEMNLRAPETNLKHIKYFSNAMPEYVHWINSALYFNAITNKTYSDTIRRIFKFYGKECIWSYLQGCKIPDEYKATAAEIVSQVMDVFDNSERPDEWKPKMQSLLIETIQECLVIANKYITDNDDDLLESRLENLIKTAAKKYVELDKDDVVEETQQQSSSSEDKSQVIDAPQIGYDEEFNSTPKYDDLKAYDAFIKQQQQEIVESYLKGREERMKQNKTIDTVATVDSNGKITYNAKNISPLQLYMLDKVFYNKNIANILKQKINSPSFSLILIYNDTADDYKVLCFNDKNELLFHYIKNENIIYFSEENYR